MLDKGRAPQGFHHALADPDGPGGEAQDRDLEYPQLRPGRPARPQGHYFCAPAQEEGLCDLRGGKWQLLGGLKGSNAFDFDEYWLWQLIRRPSRFPRAGPKAEGIREKALVVFMGDDGANKPVAFAMEGRKVAE